MTKSIVTFCIFVDIDLCFVHDAIKTDCIKNKYLFECTDDINAVFNAAFITNQSLHHQLSKSILQTILMNDISFSR